MRKKLKRAKLAQQKEQLRLEALQEEESKESLQQWELDARKRTEEKEQLFAMQSAKSQV